MAATIRCSYYGASASEPAGVTAETGIKLARADAQTSTTPTPIPTSTGTNYSWYMLLAFEVTGTGATSISNRRIAAASSFTSGILIFFKDQATYTQPSSGNKPTDSGSAGPATPSTYTNVTTSNQLWDNTSTSTGTTGRKGDFCQIVGGVDNSYAGGGGNAALPNLSMVYDEQ
jgi:hypothetical protein